MDSATQVGIAICSQKEKHVSDDLCCVVLVVRIGPSRP
jgi:hypothetical protein